MKQNRISRLTFQEYLDNVCVNISLISKFTILIQIPMVFFCVYMQPGAMGGDEVIFFLMRSFACQTVSVSMCVFMPVCIRQ